MWSWSRSRQPMARSSDTPIALSIRGLNGFERLYLGKVNTIGTAGNVLSAPGFKNVPGN